VATNAFTVDPDQSFAHSSHPDGNWTCSLWGGKSSL